MAVAPSYLGSPAVCSSGMEEHERIVPAQDKPAYRQSVADVLSVWSTDAEQGLGMAEARARLDRYGRSELAAEKPLPGWRKFLAQFKDMLVVLLLVATASSTGLWLYERDSALPYEAIAIFAIVLLNAVMGSIQTQGAGRLSARGRG